MKIGTQVRVTRLDHDDVEDGLDFGDTGVVAEHEHDDASGSGIAYIKFDTGVQKWMMLDQLEVVA